VLPDIAVTKTADQAEVFAPGENVQFTIVVTNNSLEDATIDSLVDSEFDLATHCPDAVGEVLGYNESYTCIFTEFVDADHENTATAKASDNDGNSDTESATETVEMINPSVDIEKSTNDFDADAAPGPEILAGASVTWEYLVTNDGDVNLVDITVTDSILGDICTIGSLAAGDSTTCTKTGLAEAGAYANTGTASVSYTDADGDLARRADSDDSHYFGADPSLAIDKKTADAFGNEDDNLGVLPGSTVTWNYYVTNDGYVPVENVSVSDNQGVTPVFASEVSGNGDGLFEPGEVWLFTASGEAQEGWYNNTGTASGEYTDDIGNMAYPSDSDASAYYGLTPGAVTNSSLCDYGGVFNLIFTPDFNSGSNHYKLSDSNPGQTFYNLFYDASVVGDEVVIEVPYPFVTQGGNPVHAYGGLMVAPETEDGLNCFQPFNELYNNALTFGLGDYVDTNGDGMIGFGDVYYLTVSGLPSEGFVYLNLHLDYGLEKTDGWVRDRVDSLNDDTMYPGRMDILDGQAYTFDSSIADSAATVDSTNVFKRLRGIGGLIYDAGDPVGGLVVKLYDESGTLLSTATTDEDGWYFFLDFVHKGKTQTYSIQVYQSDGTTFLYEGQSTLGGKVKFQEVSFTDSEQN
jgi:hypothetical protein